MTEPIVGCAICTAHWICIGSRWTWQPHLDTDREAVCFTLSHKSLKFFILVIFKCCVSKSLLIYWMYLFIFFRSDNQPGQWWCVSNCNEFHLMSTNDVDWWPTKYYSWLAFLLARLCWKITIRHSSLDLCDRYSNPVIIIRTRQWIWNRNNQLSNMKLILLESESNVGVWHYLAIIKKREKF